MIDENEKQKRRQLLVNLLKALGGQAFTLTLTPDEHTITVDGKTRHITRDELEAVIRPLEDWWEDNELLDMELRTDPPWTAPPPKFPVEPDDTIPIEKREDGASLVEQPYPRDDGKYQFLIGYSGGGNPMCVHLTAAEVATRLASKYGPGTLEDDGTDLWWKPAATASSPA